MAKTKDIRCLNNLSLDEDTQYLECCCCPSPGDPLMCYRRLIFLPAPELARGLVAYFFRPDLEYVAALDFYYRILRIVFCNVHWFGFIRYWYSRIPWAGLIFWLLYMQSRSLAKDFMNYIDLFASRSIGDFSER